MNKWLACALVALTSGCPDVKTDSDETAADPIVEFDPSKSIVPFPNNLLINQTTGKVNLPAGCNETASTKALREGVLNNLDGFGTFETAISITLTKPIDAAQLMNDAQFVADHFLLYKSTDLAGAAIPLAVFPGSSIRYATQTKNADGTLTCESPNPIDSILLVPRVPLEQKTNYIVALKTGLKTMDGSDYVASFTWSLVRQDTNPVTVDDAGNVVDDRTPLDPSTPAGLASLQGINLLWNAHKPVLDFLTGAKGHSRDDILLAWSFKTQTVQDALDKTVAGTPTTLLNDVAVTGPIDAAPVPISVGGQVAQARTANVFPFEICDTGAGTTLPEPNDIQCFLKVQLGLLGATCTDAPTCGPAFVAGTARCGLFGCSNVNDVLAGRVRSPQFQIDRPNAFNPAKPIPGPWADPVKPAKVKDEQLNALLFIPTGAMPAGGWPTALFQHGLGQSNTNILVIGGQLARDPDGAGAGTGFASIAINAVAHGDRRVQNTNAGTCATVLTANCFAGFLSPDLGATRDNIRQTVLDHQQVIASLKKCTGGAANCGTFVVNPAQIVYIGQSLGGIIGGVTSAVSSDIKTAVLNVPGVGWADIFENTDTLDIRCTLVDGLIDAGTLVGDKRDTKGTPAETDDTGLCVGQEWKTQPGYRQFAAIGRWVLDPGDPANFVPRLAMSMGMKKFLIQEVVADKVVPNIATANMAALTGRTSAPAKMNTALTPTPSDPILAAMPASKYLKYTTLPPNLGAGFPGNTYSHGSLLSPAPSVNAASPADQCTPGTPQFCDGVLATGQMVVDAITYLQLNK